MEIIVKTGTVIEASAIDGKITTKPDNILELVIVKPDQALHLYDKEVEELVNVVRSLNYLFPKQEITRGGINETNM